MDEHNDILTGTIWKQLVLFGVPLLVGNLFQQLYGSVDSVIVGRYVGGGALAAVGSTTSLIFLVVSFFQGIATGGNVVIAQFIGAGDKPGVRRSISSALVLSAVSGVILAVFFTLLTPHILRWMLTPEDIFGMTDQYMRIYMLSVPAISIYNTGTAVLRSMGDSRRPLYFLVLTSGVNIVLDLLFVRVFRWGVAGAAVATVLAQALSAVLILYVLARKIGQYNVTLRGMCFDRGIAGRILLLGLPAAIQSSAVSLANVLFQSQVNIFGSVAVAGYSAGNRINAFIYMPCTAFGLAATTFVGQNYGAGLYRRVLQCGRVCLGLSLGITFGFGVITYLLRSPLLRIFTDEAEVLAYGDLTLTIIGLTSFLWAFPQVLGCVINGVGRSIASMLIIMANMCGVRLLWIFMMLPHWNDIRVPFLGYPLSWATASICMVIYYRVLTAPLRRGEPLGTKSKKESLSV